MSKEFNLMDALAGLYLDPTAQNFNEILNLLKNIACIMREVHRSSMCCVEDVLGKLTIPVPEVAETVANRFISGAQLGKILREGNVPSKINAVLIKLLRYLLVSLSKGDNGNAPWIWQNFNELHACVLVFRNHFDCDNSGMDEIVVQFGEKLITTIKQFSGDDFKDRFHLSSVARKMLTEICKSPLYSRRIVKQLTEEMKLYYELVNALPPDAKLNEFFMENQLNLLLILKKIVDQTATGEEDREIFQELRNILKNATSKCPREAHLVGGILRMTEIIKLNI